LLFFMKGEGYIACNAFASRPFKAGEMLLIPIGADMRLRATRCAQLMQLTFDELFHISERTFALQVSEAAEGMTYDFTPVPIHPPLSSMLEHLMLYFKQGMNLHEIHTNKQAEVSIILHHFYPVKEVARLLHPIAGKNISFRLDVMRSVGVLQQHPSEMAGLFGVAIRTFNRLFRDEFDTSPYHYALQDKAAHVAFQLLEMKRPIAEVRNEYGFHLAGHFTRFCKENLGDTPMHLSRQAAGKTV